MGRSVSKSAGREQGTCLAVIKRVIKIRVRTIQLQIAGALGSVELQSGQEGCKLRQNKGGGGFLRNFSFIPKRRTRNISWFVGEGKAEEACPVIFQFGAPETNRRMDFDVLEVAFHLCDWA
jgi:hypothetical protein